VLILTNAVKAITRSKGRNILILVIVAAIAGASSVALAIRHAAASAEASGLSQLTITGTIGVDRQALMQAARQQAGSSGTTDPGSIRDILNKYPALGLDQLKSYASSAHVQEFRYSETISVNAAGDAQPVSNQDTSSSNNNQSGNGNRPGGEGVMIGPGGVQVFDGRSLGNMTLVGYGSESSMTGFTSGTNQISGGTMIDLAQADNNCLVSDEFATFNSLSVGDKLIVANPAATTETYELTIAATYSSTTTTTSGSGQTQGGPGFFSTAQDPANQVLVSYPTAAAIVTQSASVATDTTDSRGNATTTALTPNVSGTYVFANTDDFNAFGDELKANGLDPAYTLTSTDLDMYNASLVPLKNVASFAQTLLWIVLGVGAVVLVAIAIFSIRERKYEVGVLTAIGVAKPKVALQFVTEMLVVTLLGLVVGLGVGAAASVPVANNLLSAQVAQQQSQAQSIDGNFGRPGGMASGGPVMTNPGGGGRGGFFGRTVDYVSQINATIDWTVVLQLAGIGLVLAILASAAGVIFVMRYEPLTILANRS